MSEQRQQPRSPLLSERGVTRISDTVVAQIAGMAAGEVPGVHMGGNASRAAGGFVDRITGSSGQKRGVSVEVGRTEVALDLTMGIDYGRNIREAANEVRRRIVDQVETMTGLSVTELNVVIGDIVFPEEEGYVSSSAGRAPAKEDETAEIRPDEDETREHSRSGGGSSEE